MDKSTLGVYHGRRVPTPSLANARPFARRHPTRRNPVPPLNTGSITCQLLIELGKDVGKSEVAKRRNSGAGRPGRVTGGLNEGLGSHILSYLI